jgi:Tfp pilus assembly protein PilF
VIAERSVRRHLEFTGGAMSINELARYYLTQGKTVRAAALMMKLIETEPTPENLELLADVYMQQGLFDDAKELYLRVVRAGLK